MSSWTDERDGAHLFIPLARETVELLASKPDPLVCIAKVVEMRGWVDAVLEEYVVEARRAGHGWGPIASQLGVSRQAAWQRYAGVGGATAADADYLQADEIWSILTKRMRAGQWYELHELYGFVEHEARLTESDLGPDAPGSNSPRWQRNVRNVLQRRKTAGDIDWDGQARYLMA